MFIKYVIVGRMSQALDNVRSRGYFLSNSPARVLKKRKKIKLSRAWTADKKKSFERTRVIDVKLCESRALVSVSVCKSLVCEDEHISDHDSRSNTEKETIRFPMFQSVKTLL